jgi:nucleoside-diphosphate-sugar epimerase
LANCLVTGGAGFIGSHLAERLVRDGHRVRVVDNLSMVPNGQGDWNLKPRAVSDVVFKTDPESPIEKGTRCNPCFHQRCEAFEG